MVYMCVKVRASIGRQASWTTSFELGLSRTLSDDTDVLTLHPNPYVRDWDMHLLSDTEFVNDMTWTRKGPIL